MRERPAIEPPTGPVVFGTGPGAAAGQLLDGSVCYSSLGRIRRAGPARDTLNDHLRRYGKTPRTLRRTGSELIETLEAVGLTGRGGAHFPAATKWRTVLAAGGGGYVVANAAEGEPASAKDAALLQHRPHLVLDGLAAAAGALGAVGTVVWLHRGADESHRSLTRALAERHAAALAEPAVHLFMGPDQYLTGESSAVLRALAGGPALPAFSRVPAARAGLAGLPTLVHNVETLARVGLLTRTGPLPPPAGPLVTIVQESMLTVCELPSQTTLDNALRSTGIPGPLLGAPQAVLVGGYGGSWLDWSNAAHLTVGRLDGRRPLSADADQTRRLQIADTGPSLGAGVIAPLPAEACGIAETAAVLDYLARSSARQCGPCVFGTRALADTMARIASGAARRKEVDQLRRLTGEVHGRGACALPDGAVQLTRTALTVFAADLAWHVKRGQCRHPGTEPVLPVPGAGR